MLLQKLAMSATLARYGLAKMAMPPLQGELPPINFDANPRLQASKKEMERVFADYAAQVKKDDRNAALLAAALITPVVGYGAYSIYQDHRRRRGDYFE